MALTTEHTLDDLVEETFSVLYRHTERPATTTIGSNALSSTTDTQMTLASVDAVGENTLLEFPDGEQARVRTVDDDTRLVTVERSYNGTTAAGGHSTSEVVTIDPTFSRVEVTRWIRRWFNVHGNKWLPYTVTEVFQRDTGYQTVTMPAATIDVLNVQSQSSETGMIVDIAGWELKKDVPVAYYPTGKVLRINSLIRDDDELWITYTTLYPTDEASYPVPVGAEDLPVLFAAAYAVGRREVSRLDLDELQEWNQEAAIRGGQNLRLMRELWGEYYRRLDEAKGMHDIPKHRPYRKMPRIR